MSPGLLVFVVTMTVLMLVEAGGKLCRAGIIARGGSIPHEDTVSAFRTDFLWFLAFGIWGLVELLGSAV